MVKKLADSGVPLFICSSNTRKVIENILKKTGTSACFRQIVSREDTHQRKPDPEGLMKIISENKLNSEKVLFIGDRDVDRQAGSSAGIETRIIASGSSAHLAL
jgi:HAD superfamily hydrolase (TIGR01549 family)